MSVAETVHRAHPVVFGAAVPITRGASPRDVVGRPVDEVFTEPEQQRLLRDAARAHRWAGQLAAKLAVKELYGSFGTSVALRDLVIGRTPSGRPVLQCSPPRPGAIGDIFLSITHTRQVAVAIAVADLRRTGD